VQLVEENLPFLSYEEHSEMRSTEEPRICLPISQTQEQTPIYLPTNSIGMDAQESSSDEIQLVYEKSNNPVHQISQNIETVSVFSNMNTIIRSVVFTCNNISETSSQRFVQFEYKYFLLLFKNSSCIKQEMKHKSITMNGSS
jgi:hypothetical protein